jgi:hypothetical protein
LEGFAFLIASAAAGEEMAGKDLDAVDAVEAGACFDEDDAAAEEALAKSPFFKAGG